jgi:hypothetical protein
MTAYWKMRQHVPRSMTPKIPLPRTLERQFLELRKLRKQVEELERVSDKPRR